MRILITIVTFFIAVLVAGQMPVTPKFLHTYDSIHRANFSMIPDTVVKHDTVVVAMYEKTDTANQVCSYLKGSKVKYTQGYIIRKGFVAKNVKGILEWVAQPQVIAMLDNKKRTLKNVIQIL